MHKRTTTVPVMGGYKMMVKLDILVLQNTINDNVHILVNCPKPVACI